MGGNARGDWNVTSRVLTCQFLFYFFLIFYYNSKYSRGLYWLNLCAFYFSGQSLLLGLRFLCLSLTSNRTSLKSCLIIGVTPGLKNPQVISIVCWASKASISVQDLLFFWQVLLLGFICYIYQTSILKCQNLFSEMLNATSACSLLLGNPDLKGAQPFCKAPLNFSLAKPE